MDGAHFEAECHVDLTWVGEVPGLRRVEIRNVFFSGTVGRRELWPLLEGRRTARLKACRHCGGPIDGDPGRPDECPEEMSFRCVLAS